MNNCFPGCNAPVIYKDGSGSDRKLRTMKWGLVPSKTKVFPGSKPNHFKVFNARIETAAISPMFSKLVRGGGRCAIMMDGFYEWKEEDVVNKKKKKQPYYVHFSNNRPMIMAGVFDR